MTCCFGHYAICCKNVLERRGFHVCIMHNETGICHVLFWLMPSAGMTLFRFNHHIHSVSSYAVPANVAFHKSPPCHIQSGQRRRNANLLPAPPSRPNMVASGSRNGESKKQWVMSQLVQTHGGRGRELFFNSPPQSPSLHTAPGAVCSCFKSPQTTQNGSSEILNSLRVML